MSYQPPVTPIPQLSGLDLRPRAERYMYSRTPYWFSIEELGRLRELVTRLDALEATVGPELARNSQIRAGSVRWIEPSEEARWLYSKIGDAIRFHNQTYYGYEISGIEHLQFAEYPEGNGYYGRHMDWGGGSVMGRDDLVRKLSFTIQLSNPESYDGGDLILEDGREPDPERQAQTREFGCITVFPSWVLHQVTPVTRGTRRALVGWCLGPDFK